MTERMENSASAMQEILVDTEGFLTDFKTLDPNERTALVSSIEEAVRRARRLNKNLIRQNFSGDPLLIGRPGAPGRLALLRENGLFTLSPDDSELESMSSAAKRLYREYYYPNIQQHGQQALAHLALDKYHFNSLMDGIWVPDGKKFRMVNVETIEDLKYVIGENFWGKLYRSDPGKPGYHGWFVAEALVRFVTEWDALRSQAVSD